jgi:hypothetical protein
MVGAAPMSAARAPGLAPLPAARDVIARHVQAVGGAAALQRLRSRYVWAKFDIAARRLQGTVELFTARPNRRLVKLRYPDAGTETTGFDGSVGWSVPLDGPPRLLQGAELAQARDDAQFDFDLHPDSLFRSIETVDVAPFDGRPCHHLRLVSTTGRQWDEYYDVSTGLFAGSFVQRATPKGPVTVRTVATNYKDWDGVRLPERLSILTAGTLETITVAKVEHNRVDSAVFELPRALRSAAVK